MTNAPKEQSGGEVRRASSTTARDRMHGEAESRASRMDSAAPGRHATPFSSACPRGSREASPTGAPGDSQAPIHRIFQTHNRSADCSPPRCTHCAATSTALHAKTTRRSTRTRRPHGPADAPPSPQADPSVRELRGERTRVNDLASRKIRRPHLGRALERQLRHVLRQHTGKHQTCESREAQLHHAPFGGMVSGMPSARYFERA